MEREPDWWVSAYQNNNPECPHLHVYGEMWPDEDQQWDCSFEAICAGAKELYRLRVYLKSPPDPNTEE